MFDWIKDKGGINEKIVIGLLILLLVSGGIWRGFQQNPEDPGLVRAGFEEPQEVTQAEPDLITVHLVGAVNNPGIYHLPDGSRVYELLDAAGGLNAEADQETINQARPLLDGEQIYIYEAGVASELNELAAGYASGKININTASAAELTALPGIGDVRAGQIVAHREKHGLFSDIRELMDVNGIGEKTFENFEALITVY